MRFYFCFDMWCHVFQASLELPVQHAEEAVGPPIMPMLSSLLTAVFTNALGHLQILKQFSDTFLLFLLSFILYSDALSCV